MSFDPAQATAAYIDSLGPEALAKAAAYTSGGHWLLLWGLLVSAVTTWLLIRSGLLERLAARLNRHRKRPNLTAFLVSAATFLLLALLALPWTLYESYFREKGYGRTSQPLADFLGQSATSLAISAVVSGLLFVGVYALIRRAGKSWWIWSGGLVAAGLTAVMLLGPIFIEPIFNDYKPVPAGEVRDALVVQAAAAGVPADRIFVFDGSRQSNNFTANVSGLFGSARIAISDIAFKGASLDEVKAVTGHEIGHYVSGHIWRMVGVVALLAMLFFWLADRLYPRFARLFGSRASLADPVGLPVLLFIAGLFGLLATPLMNAISRIDEKEADDYSLKTVNLPDALSTALVKTAEYRYPRPTDLQEMLFYSHPSVEKRVRSAMEWKAAHPANAKVPETPSGG
ncbi:M48 family metallopeptidase [Sandaracinobacteroides hominis]|uniref:M48 family metallopeptidase n=1 Tax=Sandaracinobacteroides hominis TaxID=2780086 RepID=UPI0018F2B5CE|nr:M48 family metallopeptidase [Sandaracinobacteroides hominis]